MQRFTIGEPVYHTVHGRGTVRSIESDGVLVDFERVGARRIGQGLLIPETPGNQGASRVYPDLASLDHPERFVPVLTHHEKRLVAFLDEQLDDDWRIYVRPHLDGDLPSAATLSRQHGVVLWDVDDAATLAESTLRRIGSKNGIRLRRLERMRERIYGVYLPELGERISERRGRFGTVRLGVFAPNLRRRDVKGEVPSWLLLICSDDLGADRVGSVAPSSVDEERLTESEWLELRSLLANYYRRPEALTSVRLTRRQEHLAQPEPGFHRIDGVAGSGKTLVLASRAAQVAERNERALIVTFNRTLVNYVRGTLRSLPEGYDPTRVWVRHFHEVCWLVMDDDGHRAIAVRAEARRNGSGLDGSRNVAMPDEWYTEDWPRITLDSLDQHHEPEHMFDAVLIDEAQDLTASYLEVLLRLTRPGGQMVAVTDDAQRVYKRQPAFAERGVAKHFGRPRVLNTGHRLSRRVAESANSFSSKWGLRTDPIAPSDEGLGLDQGRAVWIGCGGAQEAAVAAVATVSALVEYGARPDQIAVLVPNQTFGAAMVQLLGDDGHGANHIFMVPKTGAPLQSDGEIFKDEDAQTPEALIEFGQSLKTAFAYGDQRLKVCTIHSFKGWEADFVVLVCPPVSQVPTSEELAAVYVAVTRPRSSLFVIGVEDPLGLESLLQESASAPARDMDAEERFATYLAAARRRSSLARARVAVGDTTGPMTNPEPIWEGLDMLTFGDE